MFATTQDFGWSISRAEYQNLTSEKLFCFSFLAKLILQSFPMQSSISGADFTPNLTKKDRVILEKNAV